MMPVRVAMTAVLLLGHVADASVAHKKPTKPADKKNSKPSPTWYDPPPLLGRNACRLLYVATAVNPAMSVCANEYTGILMRRGRRLPGSQAPAVDQLYRALFYFARLKPRLLFVIGACVRALQTVTVIEYVFDPPVGVGFGLNLLALLVSSQWPAPLVLGWAVTKPFWRLLGARSPRSDLRVPISMSRWL